MLETEPSDVLAPDASTQVVVGGEKPDLPDFPPPPPPPACAEAPSSLASGVALINTGDFGDPCDDRFRENVYEPYCRNVCVSFKPGFNGKLTCVSWDYVCGSRIEERNLFLSYDDLQDGDIFGTYTYGGWDDDYKGCGIKAAQNVLRYFGLEKSQQSIRNYIATIQSSVFSQNIAVLPNALRNGLQDIFDQYGVPYTVHRWSGVSESTIKSQLADGLPVIALVNNGNHWVVISGWDRDSGYYVQDDWIDTRRTSLDMSPLCSGCQALLGIGGYSANTIITFERD